ncbi:hypothetical protein ZIOFF_015173 [Zingiber officinale]|uniref:Uncharacterized protein n=1 Tax=Zingiber officinale TaxID=94328 RepID=A0A8J5HQW6_ZINOF|nr:hypothetical protein ZIOFF_015173 [Zingiber officinale]
MDDIDKYDKVELSVLLCDDNFIRKINKEWRDVDQATDVLSMSQHIPELDLSILSLGDVVMSLEIATKQAKERTNRKTAQRSLSSPSIAAAGREKSHLGGGSSQIPSRTLSLSPPKTAVEEKTGVHSNSQNGGFSLRDLAAADDLIAGFSWTRVPFRLGSQTSGDAPVYLNVYDLTPINGYMYWAGLGIFHTGVEGSLCNIILPEPLKITAVQHDSDSQTEDGEKQRLTTAFSCLSSISMNHRQLSTSSFFIPSFKQSLPHPELRRSSSVPIKDA